MCFSKAFFAMRCGTSDKKDNAAVVQRRPALRVAWRRPPSALQRLNDAPHRPARCALSVNGSTPSNRFHLVGKGSSPRIDATGSLSGEVSQRPSRSDQRHPNGHSDPQQPDLISRAGSGPCLCRQPAPLTNPPLPELPALRGKFFLRSASIQRISVGTIEKPVLVSIIDRPDIRNEAVDRQYKEEKK